MRLHGNSVVKACCETWLMSVLGIAQLGIYEGCILHQCLLSLFLLFSIAITIAAISVASAMDTATDIAMAFYKHMCQTP